MNATRDAASHCLGMGCVMIAKKGSALFYDITAQGDSYARCLAVWVGPCDAPSEAPPRVSWRSAMLFRQPYAAPSRHFLMSFSHRNSPTPFHEPHTTTMICRRESAVAAMK